MQKIERWGEVQSLHLGRTYAGFIPPLMTVRCYAVDGLLVDSGLSIFQKTVQKFVQENAINQAFITHHHEDHSGNCQLLAQQKIPMLGHKIFIEKMQRGFSRYLYQRLVWGPAQRVSPQAFAAAPTILSTPHFNFECISTPGHCPDLMVLYEPQRGWLFAGDLFLSTRIKYFRGDEDFYLTVQSLQKVATLPVTSIFCAHNPVLQGGQKLLQDKIQYLLWLQDQTQDLYQRGFSVGEISRKLLGREDPFLYCLSLGDFSKKNLVRSILFGSVARK